MKKALRNYLNQIEQAAKQKDCFTLVNIMEEESGYSATLHGKIVGFGSYRYTHASGRSGDAIVTGFLPRTQDISIYVMPGFTGYSKELAALGKYRTGKCCLYVRKLADIDAKVLRKIIRDSVAMMQKNHECRQT